MFLSFLCKVAIDIIQPDVVYEDGLDGFKNTLQTSRYFGVRASPRKAYLPPWSKMGQGSIEPVEWDVMENPSTSLIPLEPFIGLVSIPDGVGIGIEIDHGILRNITGMDRYMVS
ncbi:putative enolase superfamily enzyme [Bacillus freudenreichii]|nr:putative enolase superfamily enzyme [Bacillus freudenreichii]